MIIQNKNVLKMNNYQYRDVSIDILRGLAILLMVAAHVRDNILIRPHPTWLCFGSYAAPLFIFISGMMVALTTKTKEHNLKYFILRGLTIIAFGAFVDLFIWKIYPLLSMDVLYLIGFSIPLAYMFLHLNNWYQWIIVIFVFLLTPVFQKVLGYTDYPTEIYLWENFEILFENPIKILKHWIIDGWFPIFPWLGFSFLGVIFANFRWKNRSTNLFCKKSFFFVGLSLFIIGCLLWKIYPVKLIYRESEAYLFYPPTPPYILTAIGVILILFSIVDYKSSLVIYRPLHILGKSSLFIYILHLFFIEYIIKPFWSETDFQTCFIIFLILLCVLILIAYGLEIFKNKWKVRFFIIRVLIGA